MTESEMSNTRKVHDSVIVREKGGRFAKGHSANPGGGPKGRRTALQDIDRSIQKYEEANGVPYWEAVGDLALKLAKDGNTSLLCKIVDKYLPSKYEADVMARPYTVMPALRLKDGTEAKFDLSGNQQLPAITEVTNPEVPHE